MLLSQTVTFDRLKHNIIENTLGHYCSCTLCLPLASGWSILCVLQLPVGYIYELAQVNPVLLARLSTYLQSVQVCVNQSMCVLLGTVLLR